MSTNAKLPLDMLYQWENNHKDRLYMTQPMGDGTVDEFTWGRAVDEASSGATGTTRQPINC